MADRPTGTVTFLFTDIEGSTKLWEQHPETMQVAVARHDALLRQVVQEHGGYVVKTTGDGLHAAFRTAQDACTAAVHAQRALRAEPWGDMGVLSVRMGLHVGAAEERDGDYFGPALNRAARLMAVGHGGQILLSQATYDLVRDQLPPGTDLRDLGEHLLKDLIRPERIFQVVAAGLEETFPPLKTLDKHPNNLPIQPTPFIGREHEVEAASLLLRRRDVRLLVLTGPGGIGKTRLGLQVAAEIFDDFADGVFFVDLAPISNQELVGSTIAQVLGVRELGGQPPPDILKNYLRDKNVLLVLDNFEHMLGAAHLLADLLGAAPSLKMLVTSRAVLHLRSERIFPVGPLKLPEPQQVLSAEQLMDYEGLRLFIDRAQASQPSFRLTNDNAQTLAEICCQLDGIPLALELAAARIRLLPPYALLMRLENRLSLLTSGASDLPSRHQTLRATIDWSYVLLSEDEQCLFQMLSVFRGACGLEAIAKVHGQAPEKEIDILNGLQTLVDESLLQQAAGAEHEARYSMLETIREYAQERLTESGQAEMVSRRHADVYKKLSLEGNQGLRGPQEAVWLKRLEDEHDNLRAAIDWSLQAKEFQIALTLVVALVPFWWSAGHLSEGRKWLEAAVQKSVARRSLSRRRAKALSGAALLARDQGDLEQARVYLEESLAIFHELNDKRQTAVALGRLGTVFQSQGKISQAKQLYHEAIAIYQQQNNEVGIADNYYRLGWAALQEGDYASAQTSFEKGASYYRVQQTDQGLSGCLAGLGWQALECGNHEQAQLYFEESLTLQWKIGTKRFYEEVLSGLAAIAAAQRRDKRAAQLWGLAQAVHEATGLPFSPIVSRTYKQLPSSLRSKMGAEMFATAMAEGRRISLEKALAFALESAV